MVNELENIDSAIIESLEAYYNRLADVGYVKQSTVDKLLILSFISDIIHDFPPLDENDYNRLYKVWDCLASKECMISYEDYKKYSGKAITNKCSSLIRISDNNIRVSNNQIRTTQL